MPNRLAAETSPYLRQHAQNPVDWWPWGDEAFARARELDRPVVLSVGYSACHWCHVMAHESFEDPAIAALMNELFISIKVDREERPDVDSVYMQAVQATAGQGGWPMTVFLTPDAIPFFGGTYFPPVDRMGMRGFPSVLRAASEAYHHRRDAIEATGRQLRELLTAPRLLPDTAPCTEQLDDATKRLVEQGDTHFGGFGPAPKFPHSAALEFLLRRRSTTGDASAWATVEKALEGMSRGGINDQVGGGFHRYSVDERWAIPHFEKMLYDNAQLAPLYLHAFQLSGDPRWRAVVEDTLDYVAREMLLGDGGFAASQDADTAAGEGRFFVWNSTQLAEVLGEKDGAVAARLFGVSAEGNFEDGLTVLSLACPESEVAASLGRSTEQLLQLRASIKERLLAARAQRPAPTRDDKVVTSWNALMLRAFADAGAVLDRPDYVAIATRSGDFLIESLLTPQGVMRTWMNGVARIGGFLEDYSFLTDALVVLYEATGGRRYLEAAIGLAGEMIARFFDPATTSFYDTAADADPLLVRPRGIDDNPLPAGQSLAAHALLRLHALTGEARWRNLALKVVEPLAAAVGRSPLALGNLAWALDLSLTPPRQVVVAGDRCDPRTLALVAAVHRTYDPYRVLAWGDLRGLPGLEDKCAVGGLPAVYVCENFSCRAPVTDLADLAVHLGGSAMPVR